MRRSRLLPVVLAFTAWTVAVPAVASPAPVYSVVDQRVPFANGPVHVDTATGMAYSIGSNNRTRTGQLYGYDAARTHRTKIKLPDLIPYGFALDPVAGTAWVYVRPYGQTATEVQEIDLTSGAVVDSVPVPFDVYVQAMVLDGTAHRLFVLGATYSGAPHQTLSSVDTAGTAHTVHSVVRTFNDGDLRGLIVDPTTDRLYAGAGAAGNFIDVFDGSSLAVVDTISTGSIPAGLYLDVAGQRLYVSLWSFDIWRLAVVRLSDDEIVKTLPVPAKPWPYESVQFFGVDPALHAIVATENGSNQLGVFDTRTGDLVQRFDVQHPVYGLDLDPGTHAVYVNTKDKTLTVLAPAS